METPDSSAQVGVGPQESLRYVWEFIVGLAQADTVLWHRACVTEALAAL